MSNSGRGDESTMTIDQAMALAVGHHQRGQLQQAEAIYRRILQAQPHNVRATHLLGVLAHQVGRHDVALELINRSLAAAPDEPQFYNNLSEVLRALSRPREAVEALRRALALRPDEADFVSNLGVALYESGDAPGGEETLRRAIALNGHIPEPHLHLARALRESDRRDEALAEARRAVELAPQNVNMIVNLGLTLAAAGELSAAEAECRRSLTLDPNSHLAHSSLGSVLIKSSRYDEAGAAYARALAIQPNFAPAHSGLAAANHNLGRYDAAIAGFRRAIELSPRDHGSYAGLGLSYLAAGRAAESAQQTRHALELKPDWPEYLNNLAVALEEMGRFDEAMEVLRRAVSLPPPHAHAQNNLAKRLSAAGLIEEAIRHFRRACELSPEEANIRSNMLLAMHYLPDLSPEQMFAEHRTWAQHFATPRAADIRPHENDRTTDRRLRIGYVSPDFAAHSVADFLEPLLEHHDHAKFEIFCYVDVPRPDAYTHRLRRYADVWTDIAQLKDDDRVVEMIRAHRIDILVDLAGHTARNRMLVFARKPAPVQVTYLGYPDTTGLEAIDWRISDAIADPPGTTEQFHTESLLRLPRTFLCYRPFPDAPEVGAMAADRADAGGRVTFASFNNLSKITPRVVEIWSRVLTAVPGSRMLIKAAGVEGSPRQRLIDQFAAHGIPADRLELVGRIADLAQHFGKYNEVDIALDTFPYCGTTTTCEALWMGVPVVTLVGQTHMSRVGLSLLTQVGLSDLAAADVEQYVATAAALASDRSRLRELRAGMRDRLRASPLLDGPGVTRELEAAYRAVWAKWVTSS